MFAMVHGAWPRVTHDGVDLDALEAEVAAGRATEAAVREATERLAAEVVQIQVDAGLELVTDGQVRFPDLAAFGTAALSAIAVQKADPDFFTQAWRATAGLTDRPVAQAVPGPYSLGRGAIDGPAAARWNLTLAFAEALGTELRTLADAGCPVVIVEEPAAVSIGADAAEGELFAEAQRRLLAPVPELHAMLAISGGSAAAAGPGVIFAGPYRSHLFDLIAGPDDWILVRAAPPERGIVCAALRAGPDAEADPAPLLVWAANYAASTGLRGLQRVGLANATPLRRLSREQARTAAKALGRAARFAAMSPADAVAAGLDPRTFSNRRPKPTPAPKPTTKRTRKPKPTTKPKPTKKPGT